MLLFVRHGETAANAESRLLGRLDPPLTPTGALQAAAAARAVTGDGGVARVVSSPLRRCIQTAEAFGAPVEVDERWVELDYGNYDGMPLAEVPAELWSRWREDATYAPPGGESLAAVGARVRAACEALAGDASEMPVVVVSHVSPIKAAVAWALGVGDGVAWRMHLTTGSICRIMCGPASPVVHSFNETAHLRDLGTPRRVGTARRG